MSFCDEMRRLPCRNSTVILELVLCWSDQHLLDCFRYSNSSVVGSVCARFLEASSQDCGSLCHVPIVWSSRTWRRFQYLSDSSHDVAQNIIYSPREGTKGPWVCLLTNSHCLVLLNCFPLFLHFLASLIKLTLWLKFFHRQKAGRGRGMGKDHRVLTGFTLVLSPLSQMAIKCLFSQAC